MSKTVFRYDERAGSLRSPTRTAQGFLRADGHAARVGIYKYRRADGSFRYELRPPEEVFHPDSLASYDGAPITIGHPRDATGALEDVTADNVRKYEVGTVSGAARRDGDLVATTSLIKDAAAIKRVEGGMRELSPGYRIEYDETPGVEPRYATPDNPTGRYDGVQRKIRVNHQALVPEARGGHSIQLRMDDAELVLRADGELTAKERHHLPGSMFAAPEHEGLPLEDAAHVRDAMARFNQEKFKDDSEKRTAYRKIVARAKALDIDATKFAEEHRTDAAMVMPATMGVPAGSAAPGTDADGDELLTSIERGHQHLVRLMPAYCSKCYSSLEGTPASTAADGSMCCYCPRCGCCCNAMDSGRTSSAIATGDENAHEHDWIRNADGSITVGMTEGHTHAAPAASAAAAARGDSHFDRSASGSHRGSMTTTQTGQAPPPDAAEQIRLATVRADEAERLATEQRTRADAAAADRDGLQAELNTLKERLRETENKLNAGAAAVETAAVLEQRRRADAAERDLRQLRDSFPGEVRRRASLVAKATAVLPTMRCDGLTDREILTQSIRHLVPKEPTGADVSDDYLRRRFDALVEDRATYGASLSRASQTLAVRHDSAPARQQNQQQRADQLPWNEQWKAGVGEYATNHKGG